MAQIGLNSGRSHPVHLVKRRFQAKSVAQRLKPRGDAWRLAITFCALMAFAFQSYVTQTHIHMTGSAAGIATASADGGKPSAQHDRYPANQDPSNCPICQDMVHSGSFITPAAIAAVAPSFAVSVIAIFIHTAIAIQPASHSWRGRAPPHA